MTSLFDALHRILVAYQDYMDYQDFTILYHAIDAIHCLQHQEGNHRIDMFIYQQITAKDRLDKWINPISAEKLYQQIKQKER